MPHSRSYDAALLRASVAIALVAVATTATALHKSQSRGEVVRGCFATTKPQVEHYRPGGLNELANMRDCESVNGH